MQLLQASDNVEKLNKKKEKLGINPNTVTTQASTNTKNIKNKTNVNKNNNSAPVKYKQGSMAAKANMVKEYNDKNRK